jgi:hypothetical protein
MFTPTLKRERSDESSSSATSDSQSSPKKMKRICMNDNCLKRSNFGYDGDARPSFCKTHMEIEMVNVVSRRCLFIGCDKMPSFGVKGTKTLKYCSEHASDECIDLKHKRCAFDGCGSISPKFGFKDDKLGMYCAKHQLPGMEDIISKRCKQENCGNLAQCNFKYAKGYAYCPKHKLEKMVNKMHHLCVEVDCLIGATYGYPGYKSIFCATHKSTHPGVIRFSKKKCTDDGCKTQAVYGIRIPTHCYAHHDQTTETNLVEETCLGCGLTMILDPEERTCEYCSPALNARCRLAKQRKVKTYLDANAITYDSYDRASLPAGCGRERPDFLFDAITHFVVLEIDENQHRGVQYSCEEVRMQNISQALGLPTVFIRFNPDDYKNANGKKGSTSDTKRFEKLTVLLHEVQTVGYKLSGYLEVYKLFFDGFNNTCKPKPTIITHFD